MKFAEGKLLKKINIDGEEIIFRLPRKTDARDCMDHINALVEEKAFLLICKKVSLKEEKEWLSGLIKKIKKGSMISIFVEYRGRMRGNIGLTRGILGSSHTANIGIALSKEIRGKGIGAMLLHVAEEMARKDGISLLKIQYIVGNDVARHLYLKLGYKEVGIIPRILKRKESGKMRYYDEMQMYKVIA